MRTREDKISKRVNDGFKDAVEKFCLEELGIEVVTSFSIIEMAYVTMKTDGSDFSDRAKASIMGFETGYMAAMNNIHA